ncbi:hypothetical protein H311_01115, partial [Anncaliia algerae PRA109]
MHLYLFQFQSQRLKCVKACKRPVAFFCVLFKSNIALNRKVKISCNILKGFKALKYPGSNPVVYFFCFFVYKMKFSFVLMIPREKELKELFESEDKAIEFLHAHKILPEIQFCRIDGAPLSKISDFKFKCRKSDCRKFYSSLTDTIFSRLRLKFSDFFRIAYFWIAK